MKYSNGDMDDLFRRASESYPLRMDGADWGRLASALDGEPLPPTGQGEKRRRRVVFWWFLLIPLTGIGYLTWKAATQHTAGKENVAASAKAGAGASGSEGVAANEGVATIGSVATNKSVSTDKRAATDKSAATARPGKIVAPVSEAGVRQGENGAGSGNGGPAASAVGGVAAGKAGSAEAGGEDVRKLRTRRDSAGIHADNVHGSRIGRGSGEKDIRASQTLGLAGTGASSAGGTGAAGNGRNGDHDLLLAALDLRRVPVGGGYNVVVDVVAPVVAADSPAPAAKKQTKKNSHGYIGITAAPDFSTVHFQTMKGVGTTFGVLLGYSFNDRWAVETGLNLDRKRYYTGGEYFNTKNVRTPPYSKLLNVDGTCYMWEIPVNVRYNLSTGPRMTWFATAGLSTYLMSRENYTYQYETNLTTQDSYWNIHRPSQYWFSIINLSAGFEQRIGRIGNLRLEPYVRIPLSGIGTGNLPIVSAGLNIGFTRRLW